jgi:cysteine synthase/rhodanese-related sulfurtransferase
VYESVLGLLSSPDNPTPIVRLNHVVPFEHTAVYAKLEWHNPFGSVKDRIAANLVRDAEERGTLGEIRKLVEPTSGNTGLGLAMIANAKNYELTTPLSTAIPLEKRTVLRFFGCEVIELDDKLCPAPGAPEGAIQRALDIAEQPDHFMLNQYENPANPNAHYLKPGPEIWKQTKGKVTHFVAGLGTCGTITGTGRFLKDQSSAVQVLGVHPEEGHDIPGVRSIRQLKQTKLYAPDEYDGTVEVANMAAYKLCMRLNREESIIAGPSSAMALAGAIATVPDEPGTVAVVIFPDNIFKYPTSVRKHLPEMFPEVGDGAAAASSAGETAWNTMLACAERSPDVIDAEQARHRIRTNGSALVDVRSQAEYAAQHAEAAINIPLDELAEQPHKLPDFETEIITLCAVGKRSLRAMLMLKALGYQNVKSVRGGMGAWQS